MIQTKVLSKIGYTPMEDNSDFLKCFYKRSSKTDFFHYNLPVSRVSYTLHGCQFADAMSILRKQENGIKILDLKSSFKSKWEKKEPGFRFTNQNILFDNIRSIVGLFLTLNPDYITFDFTNENSIFFQSSVNGFNIYFEMFLPESDDENIQCITNIYKNSKCIFAYDGELNDSFSRIYSYLDILILTYCPETKHQYALSEQIDSTATF